MWGRNIRVRLMRKIALSAGFLLIFVAWAGILVLGFSPKTGAYGADFLRKIVGNQPVAVLETAMFRLEDTINKTEYNLGLIKPGNPFGNPAESIAANPNATPDPAVITSPSTEDPSGFSGKIGSPAASHDSTSSNPSTKSSEDPSQTGASVSAAWAPGPVDPLGGQPGDGVWQPYIHDSSGRVVAYRTFIQPDPTRPYAFTAIVAFDLQHTSLHFVNGFEDPYAPGYKKSSKGVIAPDDLKSGLLLAAFNGGFKYEHGHFGSMANGFVCAPPQDKLGTLAISQDGQIRIGEWGKDILSTDMLVAFRQNGALVIQNGKINPGVDDSLIWGLTISGGTATLRSGAAISPDGRTLYYFAGPSLTVKTLAKAIEAVHPQAGIQLDINNFWVHFTAIHELNGKVSADPLLAKEMKADKDRYLRAYPRDFFYVTSIP